MKPRKRRRNAGCGPKRMNAEHKNHVWSYEFLFDQLEDGRQLKILPVVDNYTRECLAILVGFSITASDVVDLLRELVKIQGAPAFMRSGNGPEFIARLVKEWLHNSGIRTAYIEPGSPWENAFSESFNSRFRDELLDREDFMSLIEARMLIEEHRVHYNNERLHSSLDYLTPAEFAAREHDEGGGPAAREKADPAAAESAA